jgi:hypothetical protein
MGNVNKIGIMKYFIILVMFFVCSFSKTISDVPILNLNDSLFIFKNNTSSDSMIGCCFNDKFFIGKSKRTSLYQLDSIHLKYSIAPILKIDAEEVYSFYRAYFISKQDKIGDFTPIIVMLKADDYGSLRYILLDKEYKPYSNYILGNIVYVDYYSTYNEKHSFINGNLIKTYELLIHEDGPFHLERINGRIQEVKKPTIIDSISYEALVKLDGVIQVKKIDSVRFSRYMKYD